jgi:hypothetical protein
MQTSIGNQPASQIQVSFESAKARLQGNPDWGAEVLQSAGENRWRVWEAKRAARQPMGARTIAVDVDRFIAWGIRSPKEFLAYQIERTQEGAVQITPIAYIDKMRQTSVLVTLFVCFIFPIVMAPVIMWMFRRQTLRASRKYQQAFEKYLQT